MNGFMTTEHVQWKPLVLSKLSLLVEADALLETAILFQLTLVLYVSFLIVFSLTKIA